MHINKIFFRIFKTIIIIFAVFSLVSCKKNDGEINPNIDPNNTEESIKLQVEAVDEGDVIFHTSQGFYRYGPSIMEYEDGSMDMWMSSPGNSGSQWDWISYRHSDDGIDWSSEEVVLRPTPGSKDQCSVCDPGVIYFNGYYYLAYTGTDYYEGKGTNNSAFVARSEYPDGPFEKWNGEGWGGYPEPIIQYEGTPEGFGIGEVSFVILEDDLFVYYTSMDINGGFTVLDKADLVDNWPLTMRFKNDTLVREHQDSLDVVYDENHKLFLGFSIDQRMGQNSRLIMYYSEDGKSFTKLDSTKDYIEDYAHNLGIAKSSDGHINTNNEILIGYAYGERWGRWDLKVQNIRISD